MKLYTGWAESNGKTYTTRITWVRKHISETK